MTLKEKLNWDSNRALTLNHIQEDKERIASGRAQKVTYYWLVGKTIVYAIESYVEDSGRAASKEAARGVLQAVTEYFYGDWRDTLPTPDGKVGHEEWRTVCLWYEEVMQSLSFAAALSDWESMSKIAAYPPENKLPEAAKAIGESAWGWALITFLRGQSHEKVDGFLKKAECLEKAKRLKLLAPVLRALMNKDAAQYEKTLLAYLAYYRKSEFKRVIDKIVALDGTTLYHLGRKQGFKVKLPENVADHVIRFEE
jgi:hypothetical protein